MGRRTATRELLCNFRPFGPNLSVKPLNGFFFLGRKGRLVEDGIDVIVPSFATLLAGAASEAGGDNDPFLRAEFVDEGEQATIFRRGPWSLDGLGGRGGRR
jgi:hypothetical protein